MEHFAMEILIEQPLKVARTRRSPVAEFVDDLQHHQWMVIIPLAPLVALGKSFGFAGGLLQSKLAIAVVLTVIQRNPTHTLRSQQSSLPCLSPGRSRS